ncbi:MAG: TatD family hydrolase [Lentimonas sp.]
MSAPLYDAHCHLADGRLLPFREEVGASLKRIGCELSVVNGTSPEDWQAVVDYTTNNPSALPAIGLHPWKVNDAPDNWKDGFLQHLDKGVSIIGEIGLDQWIEGYDMDAQIDAFHWQIEQAADRNLPVSIHCLKAIDPLIQVLSESALPERGVHIHALNVPIEAARKLIEIGCYFSFNSGQLKPQAKHIISLIQAIPEERILIETDAPDFLPIDAYREFSLPKKGLNHPANLLGCYEVVAHLRELGSESLREQVATNFRRCFLD